MGKSGVALGADLYELWNAGRNLLPLAAAQFDQAYSNTPGTVSYACSRSGGLGMGANGPAGAIDAVLDLLDQATSTTSRNLKEVGEALVWVADEYAATDAAAAAEFERKKRALGED